MDRKRSQWDSVKWMGVVWCRCGSWTEYYLELVYKESLPPGVTSDKLHIIKNGYENIKIRWYCGHILKLCWKYLCIGLCVVCWLCAVLTRVAMELIFSKWRKTSLLQCDAAHYNSSLAGGPKCAKAEKTITLSIHQTHLITSWLVPGSRPGSTGYTYRRSHHSQQSSV